MPIVHFVQPNDTTQTVDTSAGRSVMQVAVHANVPGIIAECGGAAMCGTCHVYVEDSFSARLSPPDLVEEEILDAALAERRPNSRLSCQIRLTDDLDGLIVHIPPS